MSGNEKIRYVWGDFIGGRQRELYAMKGAMRCAIYTVYLGKPEDNVVRAYPKRILIRGQVPNFDKMVLSIREIYNS